MSLDKYTIGDFNYNSESEMYTLGIDFVVVGKVSHGSCVEIHSESQTEVLERAIKVLKALNEEK